jgi:hypothetical protein
VGKNWYTWDLLTLFTKQYLKKDYKVAYIGVSYKKDYTIYIKWVKGEQNGVLGCGFGVFRVGVANHHVRGLP